MKKLFFAAASLLIAILAISVFLPDYQRESPYTYVAEAIMISNETTATLGQSFALDSGVAVFTGQPVTTRRKGVTTDVNANGQVRVRLMGLPEAPSIEIVRTPKLIDSSLV